METIIFQSGEVLCGSRTETNANDYTGHEWIKIALQGVSG